MANLRLINCAQKQEGLTDFAIAMRIIGGLSLLFFATVWLAIMLGLI